MIIRIFAASVLAKPLNNAQIVRGVFCFYGYRQRCPHARIWNRGFSISATMPIRLSRPWITLPTDPLKVYFDMCIIKYFLEIFLIACK